MQRFISIASLLIISISAASAEVITCGEATAVNSSQAKQGLHNIAQQRAQADVEKFVGKKLVNPYINGGFIGKPKTLESTIPLIEVYWCQGSAMPLHSAYYSLYTSDTDGVLGFFGNE